MLTDGQGCLLDVWVVGHPHRCGSSTGHLSSRLDQAGVVVVVVCGGGCRLLSRSPSLCCLKGCLRPGVSDWLWFVTSFTVTLSFEGLFKAGCF